MVEKTAQEQQQELNQSNVMDWLSYLNPLNWPWGGMLMGLLVMTGVYFLIHNDTAQEWIGKIFGGKEKVKGFADMIDGFIETKMPWLAKLLHIDGAKEKIWDNWTPEQKSEHLQKEGMSKEVADIYSRYDAVLKPLIKKANNNTLPDEPLNDKTIFELLTSPDQKVQQFMKELLPALRKAEGETKDAKKDATMHDKVLASLRLIVADTGRLNTLFNSTNRARTLDLLAEFSAEEGKPKPAAAELEAQIKPWLDANGNVSSTLQKALLITLTPDAATGKRPTLKEALTTLAQSPDATEQDKQQILAAAVANPQEILGCPNDTPETLAKKSAALKTLTEKLGTDNCMALMGIMSTQDEAARTTAFSAFAFKDEATLRAIKTFAGDLAGVPLPAALAPLSDLRAMPDAAIAPSVAIAAKGIDLMAIKNTYLPSNPTIPNPAHSTYGDLVPATIRVAPAHYAMLALMNYNSIPRISEKITNREVILEAGIGNIAALINAYSPQPNPMLSEANLGLIVRTADALAKNPDNQKNASGTLGILNAVMSLALSPKSGVAEFAKLDPVQLAAFFKSPANSKAFAELFNGLDTKTLPQQQRLVLASLKAHFGDTKHGLNAALTDAKSAKIVLDMLQGKQPDVGLTDVLLHTDYWTTDDAKKMDAYLAHSAPKAIHDNAADLKAVMADMKKAGIMSGGTATASAPTIASAQNNHTSPWSARPMF